MVAPNSAARAGYVWNARNPSCGSTGPLLAYSNTVAMVLPVEIVYGEEKLCVTSVLALNELVPIHDANGIPSGTRTPAVGVDADIVTFCRDTWITADAVNVAYTTSTPVMSFVPVVQLSLIGVPHMAVYDPVCRIPVDPHVALPTMVYNGGVVLWNVRICGPYLSISLGCLISCYRLDVPCGQRIVLLTTTLVFRKHMIRTGRKIQCIRSIGCRRCGCHRPIGLT